MPGRIRAHSCYPLLPEKTACPSTDLPSPPFGSAPTTLASVHVVASNQRNLSVRRPFAPCRLPTCRCVGIVAAPLTAACLSYSTVLFDARTDSGSRRGRAFVFPTLPTVSGAGPVENHIIHRGKRTHYQCHCHGRGDGVAGRRQTGRTPPSENQ